MAEPDSTIRSRELGTEMRKRREALGLPQDAIRRKVGIPISKISRMETGHRGMPLHDIASMLVVYGVVILLTVSVGSETFAGLSALFVRRNRN